jgi:hypothetical protein
VRALSRAARGPKLLSRRVLGELGTLQSTVEEIAGQRDAALRLLLASRNATTALAQREFWLEFAWADQEYRVAVHRLACFCAAHHPALRDPAARR